MASMFDKLKDFSEDLEWRLAINKDEIKGLKERVEALEKKQTETAKPAEKTKNYWQPNIGMKPELSRKHSDHTVIVEVLFACGETDKGDADGYDWRRSLSYSNGYDIVAWRYV